MKTQSSIIQNLIWMDFKPVISSKDLQQQQKQFPEKILQAKESTPQYCAFRKKIHYKIRSAWIEQQVVQKL